MKNNNQKKLINVLLVFAFYIFYVNIFSAIYNFLGINNEILELFVGDIIFIIFIFLMYKNNIIKDIKKLKEEYNFKKTAIFIAKYVLIALVLIISFGSIVDFLLPGIGETEGSNSAVLESLISVSSIYLIFKVLVFATIAEELLFREALSDVIENKIVFVIISSLIYATMNVVYTNLTGLALLVSFLTYTLLSLIFSISYVKSNNNIIMVLLVKLFYNLIPLILISVEAIMGK